MIGSFASGATTSMVAKNGSKKIIPLLWIKSSPVYRFWCLRCLNDRIELPDMIGSFASGATASLVAKNGTKQLSQPFEGGATPSLVTKNGTKQLFQLFEDGF